MSVGVAPKVAAASRKRTSMEAKAFTRGCTINGSEYSIEAITKPENENAKVEPLTVNQNSPKALFGLNNNSR